jgi:hypothetical protein
LWLASEAVVVVVVALLLLLVLAAAVELLLGDVCLAFAGGLEVVGVFEGAVERFPGSLSFEDRVLAFAAEPFAAFVERGDAVLELADQYERVLVCVIEWCARGLDGEPFECEYQFASAGAVVGGDHAEDLEAAELGEAFGASWLRCGCPAVEQLPGWFSFSEGGAVDGDLKPVAAGVGAAIQRVGYRGDRAFAGVGA